MKINNWAQEISCPIIWCFESDTWHSSSGGYLWQLYYDYSPPPYGVLCRLTYSQFSKAKNALRSNSKNYPR